MLCSDMFNRRISQLVSVDNQDRVRGGCREIQKMERTAIFKTNIVNYKSSKWMNGRCRRSSRNWWWKVASELDGNKTRREQNVDEIMKNKNDGGKRQEERRKITMTIKLASAIRDWITSTRRGERRRRVRPAICFSMLIQTVKKSLAELKWTRWRRIFGWF